MITKIEAHNYRCFPELAIELDRYHVLAGPNGAGKTTLLDITALIGDMIQRQRVVAAFLEGGEILAAAGLWPKGSAKPPDPKKALDYLKRRHRVRIGNPEFGKLAEAMSVQQCQDPAFLQLRDKLREWFPGVRP